MLKDLSQEIYKSPIVSLNRYIEMALVFFNSMVALMLLTAPWYIVTGHTNAKLMQDGAALCEFVPGTVIAPFASKCNNVAFPELNDGGDIWANLHIYSYVYLGLALLASCLIGYEVVIHGVREWKDANTIGFAVQLGMLVIQVLILVESGKAVKPTPASAVDASTAETLIITAVALSSVRVAALMFFMYITFRYNPRGTFGTGSWA